MHVGGAGGRDAAMGLLYQTGPAPQSEPVDKLDTPIKSATPAQPVRDMEWVRAPEGVIDHAVIERRSGVDDGFRTRDLRIHNPAL